MALNTAHINGGVLIHSGEQILLFCDNVNIEWSGQEASVFKSKKHGRIFLTTHRVIFNNNSPSDEMQSFSFPFVTLSEVEVEQPVFGANYVKGKVRAQPNGNWVGEAKFKMTFKHGGAIEFGQALLRAAHLATRGQMNAPPPYEPSQPQWYAAPPPAYAPSPQGYYGWVPPTNVFPQHPPTDGVFMTDAPPPYPGIYPTGQQNGYGPPQGGYAPQAPPAYPQGPSSGYYPQGGSGGYPPQGPMPAGFTTSADAKAAEAAQSAYYDPNRPNMAYVPPPSYYENPPTYNQATNQKKDQ
ncbi:WW domain-binding protein 2 [Cylas formicarius]|uniref:WW domain-binding protein 2 n=1 Tax=Cylas formicarius TaxID=197179 RepID=UPI002958331C|nr:WW domain-binding protein 2 [Cylas formicarius]